MMSDDQYKEVSRHSMHSEGYFGVASFEDVLGALKDGPVEIVLANEALNIRGRVEFFYSEFSPDILFRICGEDLKLTWTSKGWLLELKGDDTVASSSAPVLSLVELCQRGVH